MDSGSVVPEIRRAFGKQGQALLARFNLLKPLVEKMIIRDVASHINVADDQLQEARLGLLQQRGYDAIEQWAELLEELGSSEDDVLERLRDCRI